MPTSWQRQQQRQQRRQQQRRQRRQQHQRRPRALRRACTRGRRQPRRPPRSSSREVQQQMPPCCSRLLHQQRSRRQPSRTRARLRHQQQRQPQCQRRTSRPPRRQRPASQRERQRRLVSLPQQTRRALQSSRLQRQRRPQMLRSWAAMWGWAAHRLPPATLRHQRRLQRSHQLQQMRRPARRSRLCSRQVRGLSGLPRRQHLPVSSWPALPSKTRLQGRRQTRRPRQRQPAVQLQAVQQRRQRRRKKTTLLCRSCSASWALSDGSGAQLTCLSCSLFKLFHPPIRQCNARLLQRPPCRTSHPAGAVGHSEHAQRGRSLQQHACLGGCQLRPRRQVVAKPLRIRQQWQLCRACVWVDAVDVQLLNA